MTRVISSVSAIQTSLMLVFNICTCTAKPVLSGHSKRLKICFQDRVLLNAGQKYRRMLQSKHSAILSTLIKLPFVIKIECWSIFEWPLRTGFTVYARIV